MLVDDHCINRAIVPGGGDQEGWRKVGIFELEPPLLKYFTKLASLATQEEGPPDRTNTLKVCQEQKVRQPFTMASRMNPLTEGLTFKALESCRRQFFL